MNFNYLNSIPVADDILIPFTVWNTFTLSTPCLLFGRYWSMNVTLYNKYIDSVFC